MKLNQDIINELSTAWLNLTKEDIKKSKFLDPLKVTEEDKDRYGITPLRMMSNPDYIEAAARILLNVQLLPIQSAIIAEMWNRPFPMLIGSRGLGKTSILAFYSMLKMALTPKNKSGGPGCKIVITGAGFRQAKQVFEYMEQVYVNSRLRDLGHWGSGEAITRESDRFTIRIGPNYAIAIPLGTGEKVRGLRANIVLADEFNSISPEIFETVIQGFAAVAADPIQAVQLRATIARAKQLGIDPALLGLIEQKDNQIIISGTAGYDFEHFADYWKKYKAYIESRGNVDKLTEYFKNGVPDSFNWEDYCIFRIPHTKVPEGFLDPKILVRAEATVNKGTFAKEYGAVFSKDSDGFFKRSLIDSCVANDKHVKSSLWPSWCAGPFDPMLSGVLDKKYVIAVDPASEVDKFSIVVLELHGQHARVVYCWTTNKKEHHALVATGITHENDFYSYCARKIRQLWKAFPCDRIGIDAQGGGNAVIEALHNKNNLNRDDSGRIIEEPFWPIIKPDKSEMTDLQPGLHIIEPIEFANYAWTYEANHGLRQDMENKTLLFPRFDQVSIELASAKDYERVAQFERDNPGLHIRPYDTFEDVCIEIEELKDELTSIVVTRTGNGVGSREKWDTPEIKLNNGKKGRMRKDRYSALVIANMIARQKRSAMGIIESGSAGGLLSKAGRGDGAYFQIAPADWATAMTDFYDAL